jgi:hypothetical protein
MVRAAVPPPRPSSPLSTDDGARWKNYPTKKVQQPACESFGDICLILKDFSIKSSPLFIEVSQTRAIMAGSKSVSNQLDTEIC